MSVPFAPLIRQVAVDADDTGGGARRVGHQDGHVSLLLAGQVQLAAARRNDLFEAGHLIFCLVFLFISMSHLLPAALCRRRVPGGLLPLSHRLSDSDGHFGGPTGRCVEVAGLRQVPLKRAFGDDQSVALLFFFYVKSTKTHLFWQFLFRLLAGWGHTTWAMPTLIGGCAERADNWLARRGCCITEPKWLVWERTFLFKQVGNKKF